MTSPHRFPDNVRFELCALVGEGATGSVYRVYDRELSRNVALKLLRLPEAESLVRLKQEFRTRVGIVHPNLLQLYELFVEQDSRFITMELLEGVDFLEWARRELSLGGAMSTTQEGSLVSQGTTESYPPGAPPLPPMALDATTATEPFGSGAPPHTQSWERLRQGLAQLLQGLEALHAKGLIHRDVKPGNVLVTPEGRVVLLDFGLVTALREATPGEHRPLRRAGTPAYMAPEQVTGAALTPATDVYAVGAMLYEILTGRWPFAGQFHLLELKTRQAPPDVRELAPEAPADLAQLAMDLLSTEPAHRPNLATCLERLRSRDALPGALATEAPAQAPLFVGRTRELALLTQAMEEVTGARRPIIFHVHGPSGMGKSSLVRHFLSLQHAERQPVLLHGRCHPQERVPYKALDAVLDSLARYLETLPEPRALDLVPTRAHALARLFPVLGRLAVFQRAALTPDAAPDPTELRQQGFLALRELLERLARGPSPLVLWIDDVQWGDDGSVPLLEELLRPPTPPLLLLLTYRSEDRARTPLLRRLLEPSPQHVESGPRVRELALDALDEEAVGALAAALLQSEDSSPSVLAVIAQAEGSPFIARELAHHFRARIAAGEGDSIPVQVDVARLVVERIQGLPAEQRRLLEVASLAGRPLARGVALQALGMGEGGRMLVAELRDTGLLREVPGTQEPSIAAYHDRIREALLDTLSGEERRRRHRAVAEALTARSSEDHESLLLYWEGAGESRQAGRYAVLSGDRAAQTLAFESAAELYRKALDLLGEHADRAALLEKLADAHANLGQALESAQRYLDAAAVQGGALERIPVRDLKRRAAEQYLKSGHFDEGWRELRSVLQALGVSIPTSFLSAVWAATWRRILFLLRRMDRRVPAPISAPEGERHRLEVLWTAATSWVMVNPMLSDAFRMMHLLRSGALEDTTARLRALALEATMELHLGGRLMEASARRLLEGVRQRVEHGGGPYDRAWYALALVNQAYTFGRWREVAEAGEHAEALFREHCPGSDWERVTLAIFHHHALAMRGDLRQLSTRQEAFVRDAVRRGDLHARSEAYVGEPVVAWLAQDRAVEARTKAEESMAAQSPRTATWPENAYRRQQFANLIAIVYTAHYLGEPWKAWRAVIQDWEGLRSSFMLLLRTTGLNLRHMRARAALAAAAALPTERSAPPEGVDARWQRPALLADVRAQLRVMDRDSLGFARPVAHLLRAGLACLEHDVAAAWRHLEWALAGFEREDMALYREAARYALGAVRGGSEGAALHRQALGWMEAQGVVRPEALVAALAPGVTAVPAGTTLRQRTGRR